MPKFLLQFEQQCGRTSFSSRTAAAVRSAAISCLWALLNSNLLSSQDAAQVMKDLLTQVLQIHTWTLNRLLEDWCMCFFFLTNWDLFVIVFLQLITCLDDHNQTTRLVTCKALQRLLVSCKDTFNGNVFLSSVTLAMWKNDWTEVQSVTVI